MISLPSCICQRGHGYYIELLFVYINFINRASNINPTILQYTDNIHVLHRMEETAYIIINRISINTDDCC